MYLGFKLVFKIQTLFEKPECYQIYYTVINLPDCYCKVFSHQEQQFSNMSLQLFCCSSGAHRRLTGSSRCVDVLFSSPCNRCGSCSPCSGSTWGECFASYVYSYLHAVMLRLTLSITGTKRHQTTAVRSPQQNRKGTAVNFSDVGSRPSLIVKVTPLLHYSFSWFCWRLRRRTGRKLQSCLKTKKKGWLKRDRKK